LHVLHRLAVKERVIIVNGKGWERNSHSSNPSICFDKMKKTMNILRIVGAMAKIKTGVRPKYKVTLLTS
jgi:hypothetical protein